MQRFSRREILAAPVFLAGAAAALPAMAAPPGATDVRAFGAIGDGETDDTQALLTAHASGKPIFYSRPRAHYRISQRLYVTSSVTGDQTEIRLKQNGKSETIIFHVIRNDRPMTISGMILNGEYDGETDDENSYGIALSGASNVTVVNNVIRNIYGDCVWVGADKKRTTTSTNIRIANNRFENARRNNVSVTSGDGVAITGNTIVASSDYGAGVDIEVNRSPSAFERNGNIRIDSNKFDVPGHFCVVTKDDGHPVGNVAITNNIGQAGIFCMINPSAEAYNVSITGNRFHANAPSKSSMRLAGIKGLTVSGNTDLSRCTEGYRTLAMVDCEAQIQNNKFCG